MQSSPYNVEIDTSLNPSVLEKDAWLVIMHASRIPPHIGILIQGNYNSLTIKGHELNIALSVLQKTIQLKKIETIFIPLVKHPVFSLAYQLEIAQHHIQQFSQVNELNTCLNPIKLFLQEFYAVPLNSSELLFELIERLKQNDYINAGVGFNINNKLSSNSKFVLPIYSAQQLKEVINQEREKFYSA